MNDLTIINQQIKYMKNREASIMHKVGNDQWGEGEGRPYKGGSI